MPSRAESLYREIESKTPEGRTAHVEGWVAAQQREGEYLEFKRTGGEAIDKKTWSQALAGFANMEGGLVVWGIGTAKVQPRDGDRKIDVANSLEPIQGGASFQQFLQDIHRDSTIEPVQGVEYMAVPASRGGEYVVCLVPEGSHKPYRDTRENQYWQRIGDSFVAIPHALLRNLFYPQSHASFTLEMLMVNQRNILFNLINNGNGTAENVFVQIKFHGNTSPWGRPEGTKGDGDAILIQSEGKLAYGVAVENPIHPRQRMPVLGFSPATYRPDVFPPAVVSVFSRNSDPVDFLVMVPQLSDDLAITFDPRPHGITISLADILRGHPAPSEPRSP